MQHGLPNVGIRSNTYTDEEIFSQIDAGCFLSHAGGWKRNPENLERGGGKI